MKKRVTPKAKTSRAMTARPKPGSALGKAAARKPERGDWRVEMLERLRGLILQADPAIVEEVKWRKPSNDMRGVPVWSREGIICTGEMYKNAVKLTFANGAKLADPARQFNASLDGNTRRAIDLHEGDELDVQAFEALIRAAVALNAASRSKQRRIEAMAKHSSHTAKVGGSTGSRRRSPKPTAREATPRPASRTRRTAGKPEAGTAPGVRLLAGGNPQMAKAEGDSPVQAYIAAIPGWKREIGRRLDALISQTVPGVRKAVKWNSPFYGIENQGWFAAFHVFARYVKVTFFKGTSLRPVPPGGKSQEGRWIDIHEGGHDFDETQLAAWIRQASELPGWSGGR